MRLRIQIATKVRQIPWAAVLAPGRALAYEWIERSDRDLAVVLHRNGLPPHGMVPFGHGAPVFPGAKRVAGSYAAAATGYVEFGSPVPNIVESFAKALANAPVLDWGGAAFHVEKVNVVPTPEFEFGAASMRTATPLVLKGSGRDASGSRTTRQAWLFPGDDEYVPYLTQNLRRKAATLGLAPDVEVTGVTWAGPQRSFYVKNGHKPGAPVEVSLRGSPEILRAVHSWGLGQGTSAGFGWVRHNV